MSEYEKAKLESEFKSFIVKNFVRPNDCRNLDQIQFYVKELCTKIEHYEKDFHYVPGWAYTLLTQYNMAQNKMVSAHFKLQYH